MEAKVCQCCAMPMETDELYGTNADGSKTDEYCNYCFVNGEVQFKGTMEEMIELCVPHMVQGVPGMTAEAAREIMEKTLPTLKYWREKTA